MMRNFLILVLLAVILVLIDPVIGSGATPPHNPRPWNYSIMHASAHVREGFTCIIHHESTSTWAHPNLGDNNADGGSSGVFQIEESTWLARSGFTMPVWVATLREQAIGALRLEQVDGFSPWSTHWACGV